MAFDLQYVLGNDGDSYHSMLANLPAGQVLQKRGIVVPTQGMMAPHTFTISGCIPNAVHLLRIITEGQGTLRKETFFVPQNDSAVLTLMLGKGVNLVQVVDVLGNSSQWYVSATNYAIFLRAYAREFSESITIPLNTIKQDIQSSLAYRLATPLLATISDMVPQNLETMSSLAHKLLVKNLLSQPGTDISTSELFAAACVTNPVFFKMQNMNALDAPLFRSEETFAGYEAHVWMPNREVERWRAFMLLLNNIPQLYQILTVTEQLVRFVQGGKEREHWFDFESPYANSILEGTSIASECFTNLFTLNLVVEGDHLMAFCQAAYFLDSQCPALNDAEADPIGTENFTNFTLSGRFGQQLWFSSNVHHWIYEVPTGLIDGHNEFFTLSQVPATSRSLKVFIDGLLQRNLIDYRLSLGSSIRSGVFQTVYTNETIQITIDVGLPLSFIAPVFATLEVVGSVNSMQYVLTGGDQTLNSLKFVMSNPPELHNLTEQTNIHYITPARLASDYAGFTQYGQEVLSVGASGFDIIYPAPATTFNYQLLVFISETPQPSNDPTKATQIICMPSEKQLDGVHVDFSAPLPNGNFRLNWWMIEGDGVALEKGTIHVPAGTTSFQQFFTAGPYFDQVVVQLQPWSSSTFGDIPAILCNFSQLYPNSMMVNLSSPAPDGFCIDYCIFESAAGNMLQIFDPPDIGQLVEVQYDTRWAFWENVAPTPDPDGFTTEFNLAVPCTKPDSMYLTLNGRLLTQGNNKQYTVDGSLIRLTFPAQADQKLWAIYPTDSSTEVLPSAWAQGYLTRRPEYAGKYAAGEITLSEVAPAGETLTVDDITFTATAGATGSVFNSQRISIGDTLEFSTIFTSKLAFTPSDVNTTSNAIVFPNHGFINRQVVTFTSTNTLPNPLTVGTSYYVANPTSGAFQLSLARPDPFIPTASVIDFTDGGIGVHSVMLPAILTSVGTPTNPNEFSGNVSQDADGTALAAAISNHPIIGAKYYASYAEGTGTTTIIARSLGGGDYNETLITSPNFIFLPADIDIVANTFNYSLHGLPLNQIVTLFSTGQLPAPLTAGFPYYVVNTTENTFQLSTVRNGNPIDLTNAGTGSYQMMYSGGSLQVIEQITGDSAATGQNFACGVTVANDLTQISNAISNHPYLSAKYRSYVYNDTVKITAIKLGIAANSTIEATWSQGIDIRQLIGGIDPIETQPFLSPDLFYYQKAPVVTLDGLSTLWYNSFGGKEVNFNVTPTLKQEPYMVTETFPIEWHPLDSMVATGTCNYPRGVFTQGLFTQHGDTSVALAYSWSAGGIDGGGTVTTDGLPVQEALQGVKNGINTVFTMSQTSRSGQNSMMVWIDGIFQSPDTYTYSEPSGVGTVTFIRTGIGTDIPPVSYQSLWVWYLNSGDQCVGEQVQMLTATSDPQIFSLSDGPPQDTRSIVVFLEGLFNLQGQDFLVDPSGTQIKYTGTIVPEVGQPIWTHFNTGRDLSNNIVPSLRWRQASVGVGNGATTTFTIPHTLTSELPSDVGGLLTFLDGLCQQNGSAAFAIQLSDVDITNNKIKHINHGLSNGSQVVIATTDVLPDGLVFGQTYYIVNAVNSQTYSILPSSVDSTTDTITKVLHGFVDGTPVVLNGDLPSPFEPNTTYYVINSTLNTFQLTPIVGGTVVDITGTFVGTMTIAYGGSFQFSTTNGGLPVDINSQGSGVHYLYMLALTGYMVQLGTDNLPTGDITFMTPPEVGRNIEVAYLRRG